jgi:hypothetical protein
MTNANNVAENEARIVRHMVEELAKAGWALLEVDDGGDTIKTATVKEAIDVMNSVEESYFRFIKDGEVRTVYVINSNGNDGWDLIADYSYVTGEDFSEVMDAVCEKTSEWECA